MGVFFSRTARFEGGILGAFTAGDPASVNATSIAPFLGHNTGSYDGLNETTLPPVPFEWIVSPLSVEPGDGSCPSRSATFVAFGLTDLATAVLTLVLACQPVVRTLSFGRLGKRIANAPKWTWSLHLTLLLIGHAVVAGMVGRTSGYESLNMLHIFTLYTARPRINTLLLVFLRSVVGYRRRSKPNRPLAKGAARRPVDEDYFPYADAYIASAVADLILQIIAAIFASVTWNRMPGDSEPKEFIGPTLQFVQAVPGLLALTIIMIVPVYRRYGDAFPVRGRALKARFKSSDTREAQQESVKRVRLHRAATAIFGLLFVGLTYLIQWSYWVQFLRLPGVLWCPPKMVQQGAVFTIFTTLANIIGAGA